MKLPAVLRAYQRDVIGAARKKMPGLSGAPLPRVVGTKCKLALLLHPNLSRRDFNVSCCELL